MKKKLLLWPLICVLVWGLCLNGCGRREAVAPSAASSPAVEAPAESSAPDAGETLEKNGGSSAPVEQPPESEPEPQKPADEPTETEAEMKLNVQVGDHLFEATLEDNAAVDALIEMMREAPIVISMRDYSGFEKVGSLGASLPASDRQTTTQAGDIVLYTGNQIVMFYGSNSWSYTRLGRIDDLTGWKDALGSGDITASFSLK